MPLLARELGWFEEANEKILGVLVLDLSDRDYACYVLGRDAKGRFRAVWIECSVPTPEEACGRLESKLAESARKPPEQFYQGDELGKPLDFFTPVVEAENQHPNFRTLISARGYSPARLLLAEMMHYFEDADGNFVRSSSPAVLTPGFGSSTCMLPSLSSGMDLIANMWPQISIARGFAVCSSWKQLL